MFWSGGGAQPSRGDRKLPAPSLPETAEHLSLPNEVMSFQGTLQILSESAILELLRNEVTWKETGHGVSKGKAEIAVQALQAMRVVQTSGAVHLQPTQSPLGCRTLVALLGQCLEKEMCKQILEVPADSAVYVKVEFCIKCKSHT